MVEFYTIDSDYYAIEDIIQGYKSVIWTERYNAPGNFQLVTSRKDKAFANIEQDSNPPLIAKSDSQRVMMFNKLTEQSRDNSRTVEAFSGEDMLRWRPTVSDQNFSSGLDGWDRTGTPLNLAIGLARWACVEAYIPIEYQGSWAIDRMGVGNGAGNPGASITIEHPPSSNVLTELQAILNPVDVGFQVLRPLTIGGDPQINFYPTTDRSNTIVLGEVLDNLEDVQYVDDRTNFNNRAVYYNIVSTNTLFFQQNGAKGWHDLNPFGWYSRTRPYDFSAYQGTWMSQTSAALKDSIHDVRKIYVDGQIIGNPWKYGTDYVLGDIVSYMYNGKSYSARVIEHTTVVDAEGERQYPALEPV